mgnify:FL=1
MNYPLVSVIIPGYNHAPYLRERIDSVLEQDYPNFEVFLMDDCSSDNSREIMEEYRGKEHIKDILFNDRNTGNTFIQWKKGIVIANGEYIWIAESDDVAEKSFLTKMVAKLQTVADAVYAFSHSTIIGANGELLPNIWDGRSRYSHDGIYESRFFCLTRMIFYNAPYNASMVVFRKRFFAEIPDDYLQFRHNGDYCFWLLMSMMGRVLEVNEPLNRFRQHDRKVSADGKDEAFLENAAIVDKAITLLRLSSYQQRCLKGKYRKRWLRAKESTRDEARRRYPRVYGGSLFDSLVYDIDKIINLSHFHNR